MRVLKPLTGFLGTLLRMPKPMRAMASCLRGGSGGWKRMLPALSTPSGTVTSAASAAQHSANRV
jgi:hypothetical protein